MKVQFSAEFVQKIKNESTVYAILWAESADSVELTVHIQSAGITPALSKKYDSYADVFSEENADLLSAHKVSDHAIDLNEKKLLYDLLYNLFNTELEVLRDYLENVLVKNWIRHSVSSAETLILFVLKKDEGLQLYVDYRELNQMIIKNRHLLSLISETLNRLSEVKYFIKLNLKDVYHQIHIKKDDEWKTAFCTHYSHFEYMIMLFELVNAPATFQAYINWALVGLIDIFCVIYLNNILIYSETLNQHHKHVKKVLERLWKFQLYMSLKKCEFSTQKVKFLRFIISITDVAMNSCRVEIIWDWLTSKIFCKVQVFLDFANFYRHFIKHYSHIAEPLTGLMKSSKDDKKFKPFSFSADMQKTFILLCKVFMNASILVHFDSVLKIKIETDASNFALADIISQLLTNEEWHSVAFWSRKMISSENRYKMHNQKLLVIVIIFKHWCHYLKDSYQIIEILTDHNNLQEFMKVKELNRR